MNKRQSEEIENRIREAADNVSPPFSEENWEAMNLLLDKEFPEKRRRRFLFFWFWPLLGAALVGGIVLLSGPENNIQVAAVKNTNLVIEDKSTESRKKSGMYENEQIHTAPVTARNPRSVTKNHIFLDKPAVNSNRASATDQEAKVIELNDDVRTDLPVILKKDSVRKDIVLVPAVDSAAKTEDDKTVKKENKRVRTSGLYFIAAGSFVNNSAGTFPSGKISEEYGVGIGYRINKKLSVQTGIYAGKKKYDANKDDYHFLPNSYYTTVDVNNINADCYVIDIPVSVRYDMVQKRKYTLYALAGISSYIMKRETYVYSYTKNGTQHTAGRTYSGNSHLFSVAGISAGYERKLNQRISILAEPYIRLPLSGVGEGKVKLHSTGLLLGIKYNLPNKIK